jgi:hypothetical protein
MKPAGFTDADLRERLQVLEIGPRLRGGGELFPSCKSTSLVSVEE